MKKIVIILFVCCIAHLLYGQSEIILQEAKKHIANFDYKTAIKLLEPKDQRKNIRPETYELLANCYRIIDQKDKARFYYEQAAATGLITPDAIWYYGELLMYEERYQEAKEQFSIYSGGQENPDPRTQLLIASCDSALAWWSRRDSTVFDVENMRIVNSKFQDWGAVPYKNGLVLISNRPQKTNQFDNYSEEKFYTVFLAPNRQNNNFGTPDVLFQEKTHMGPVVFSNNAKTIYYTKTNTGIMHRDRTDKGTIWENKLEIQIAKVANKKLVATKPFAYNKPREYSVGHPCLSPNDSILYFVSDIPGGYGGTDIYFSVLEKNGRWGDPENAGPIVNTSGDEMFPTMDSLGILYFSSNGRIGLGGLDIFRAQGAKNQWLEPENMYYPINSSGDDFHFTRSSGKTSGFFSSNRAGGVGGDDIYTFAARDVFPEFGHARNQLAYQDKVLREEEKLRLSKIVAFTGDVKNLETQETIFFATISFVNNRTKEQLICNPDETGLFSITLNRDETYTYSCIQEGYVPLIGQLLSGDDARIEKDGIHIVLAPVKKEKENVIEKNVILDTEEGKGIEYRVQVMASKEYPNWEYLDKIRELYPDLKIYSKVSPDFTRFTVGRFKTMKEATKLKNDLRASDYKDAFVVMFSNGQRKVISYN